MSMKKTRYYTGKNDCIAHFHRTSRIFGVTPVILPDINLPYFASVTTPHTTSQFSTQKTTHRSRPWFRLAPFSRCFGNNKMPLLLKCPALDPDGTRMLRITNVIFLQFFWNQNHCTNRTFTKRLNMRLLQSLVLSRFVKVWFVAWFCFQKNKRK